MNFLAHIYLSCDHNELLVGNFMADFVSNRQVKSLSPSIQQGIMLHRAIDSFTDNHPLVRQGCVRLRKDHGKYAPVVIDLLYDYVLASNWEKYYPLPLEEFSQNVYSIFNENIDLFPDKLQKRIPLMIQDDFLTKYRTIEGLSFALRMMDKRTKFPSQFTKAAEQIIEEKELFESEFHRFFPEVIELSQGYCNC